MRVAAVLNIPFITLDLEKEYKEGVVDYMVSEYEAGRVPNPDVMCNKSVKFGAFLNFALKNGADLVATGHYARIVKSQKVSACRQAGKSQRWRRKNLNTNYYEEKTAIRINRTFCGRLRKDGWNTYCFLSGI